MEVILASGFSVLEQALAATNAAVPDAGDPTYISGTASVTDPTKRFVSNAWRAIQLWLREAEQKGVDQARIRLHYVITEVEALVKEAGAASDKVREELLKLLASFTQQYVQVSLNSLPAELRIGEKTFLPKTVKVTHKLVITSSIAISLEKVLELIGTGEMEVGIEYNLVDRLAPASVSGE